ncbi:MAG: hypothetical protein Q7S61_01835 [bacterium]|nr:hypothetical protein [bacterium]
MKIYVTHASSFDYQNELYTPLRESGLNKIHNFTLPHEHWKKPFDSQKYIKESDLVFAEVSCPSTGEGIELGWANSYNIPIVCIFKKGTTPSSSLKIISDTFIEYEKKEDMIKKLHTYLTSIQPPEL